jgi:hypothetical protein
MSRDTISLQQSTVNVISLSLLKNGACKELSSRDNVLLSYPHLAGIYCISL